MSKQTTPFYYMVDASVGSGKTTAAIKMIVEGPPTQNYIYVAPTKELGKQTAADIKLADVRCLHKCARIDSDTAVHGGVISAVRNAINNEPAGTGRVVVITTDAFTSVVADISNKDDWIVILDEAFEPFTLTSLDWKTEVQRKLLTDLFKEGKNGNLLPVDSAKVNAIARGKYRGEWVYDSAKPKALCAAVMNKAKHCAWVGLGAATGSFVSYVKPSALQGFKAAYFMAALFKHTILYHLWTNANNIEHATFEECRKFTNSGMIDVHKEQGQYVNVGHLLHPLDKASKMTLHRNAVTGEPWAGPGERLLDACFRKACAKFQGEDFLWAANNGHRLGNGPAGGVEVPVGCRGLNGYKDHVNAAALAVTNPDPQQAKWLRNNTGLSTDEVYQAFRIHSVYQFLGRTAVRVRGDTRIKTFITVGYEDAKFICDQFEGSTFINQVCDLPPMRKKVEAVNVKKPKTVKVGEVPEYQEAVNNLRNVRKRKDNGTATQADVDEAVARRDDLKARLKARAIPRDRAAA